jgi:hypothetical protein
MFGALWSNATHGFPDGPPARTVIPGGLGRFVTEAIRQPSQKVGKLKERK